MPKILIVEDDLDFQRLLSFAAREAGFVANAVNHVKAVPEALKTFGPDLCVIDLAFPDGDGVGVLQHLSDSAFSGPIILISGADDRVLRTATRVGQELDLNMLPPVSKPMSMSELQELLSDLLTGSLPPDATEFREALRDDQLRMYYQPIVRLSDNAIVAAEALLRWDHPWRGLMAPAAFLPLLQANDFVEDLGKFVLTTALRDCQRWLDRGLDWTVNVNMPVAFIEDPTLIDMVAAIIDEVGIAARHLTIEVNESVAVRNQRGAAQAATKLRILGCGLAMDDFGSGYSSLLQLYRMPFSELKIDRRFIAEIEKEDEAESITRAILALGETLRLSVVAEGVETEGQRDRLRAMGATLGQGFLFGPPMPSDELLAISGEAASGGGEDVAGGVENTKVSAT